MVFGKNIEFAQGIQWFQEKKYRLCLSNSMLLSIKVKVSLKWFYDFRETYWFGEIMKTVKCGRCPQDLMVDPPETPLSLSHHSRKDGTPICIHVNTCKFKKKYMYIYIYGRAPPIGPTCLNVPTFQNLNWTICTGIPRSIFHWLLIKI